VTTTETVDGEDVTTTTTYTGKAWMKTDDFTGFWVIEDDDTPLTSGGDYDPAVPANWDQDLFIAAWEEYTDLEGTVFIYEPYVEEWFSEEVCYDWEDVTGVNGTFYSDYYFETGSLGCYKDLVFECWGTVDECAATEPGTDIEVWEPTTYTAAPLTATEILDAILPIMECFEVDDMEGWPFMVGDLVCDPEMPDIIAWSCQDAALCSQFEPSLDDMIDLDAVWTLVVDGYDAELYSGADAPELETSVSCAQWSSKFGTEDIGEEDYWCDAGRAYWCSEDPADDGTRALCSGSTPSQDSYGVWTLLRTEGSESEISSSAMEALEDDYFGAGMDFSLGNEFCVEDVTFMTEGPNGMTPWEEPYCDIETEINCIFDGVPCTIDADLARRAFNSQITPSGNLAEDPTDWPRNVFISNEALSGSALETILAGAGYLDDVDREDLAAVWQWFPALCAEKPEDSTMSYMDTCRWEFVGVTLMALSGEMAEQDFYNMKLGSTVEGEIYGDDGETPLAGDDLDDYMDLYYEIEDLEWYQTAFMTYGDELCFDAELAGSTEYTDAESNTISCLGQNDTWTDASGYNQVAD
jgi:hypothetical protein